MGLLDQAATSSCDRAGGSARPAMSNPGAEDAAQFSDGPPRDPVTM